MKLSDLRNGETAVIVRVSGHGGFRKRIMEMGFVRGQEVRSVINAPMNDPIKYHIMGYDVSLRRSEAKLIDVLPEAEANSLLNAEDAQAPSFHSCADCSCSEMNCVIGRPKTTQKNIINIAFVGNPNSGKTSLFNALSGEQEHVGNYSGVTVDVKTGHLNYKGYHFNVSDLPGTYSLSAYSPEELYVRRHLQTTMPDVIVNVVVASNLERNLYLTTELIDLNQRVALALNMYDELEASGATFNYEQFGVMTGIPVVPTVAKNGEGLDKLLNTVIELFEGKNKIARHVHINYGQVMEPEIVQLAECMHQSHDLPQQFPARYWAIKMIEGDKESLQILQSCKNFEQWNEMARTSAQFIENQLNTDVETAISDEKYGFITGALHETFTEGKRAFNRKTQKIDKLVANRWLGFPIFLLLMWLTFFVTFEVGSYPQAWIDAGFTALGEWLAQVLPDNALRYLLVDGVIAGVGAVCSFLPNILLLYLFIALMEGSGYMSRAAFIMDNIMHKMGLHGKSFIPMLMGFGCNVPAILATRTIESRSSRIITILIVPFMSCTARLPLYVLFSGIFFPNHASLVMFGLYVLGIAIGIGTAIALRAVKFGNDESPFVMELPPYRMPTLRAVFKQMWSKCWQYLRKMGTVILAATIIIWVLIYFPRPMIETVNESTQQVELTAAPASVTDIENSVLGTIGKAIAPALNPLGFDWRASVAIVASIPAKEIAVSTLGVLYGDPHEDSLGNAILHSGSFTPASGLAMMVFMLLCFPCMASIAAIYSETKKKRWAVFSIIYNTAVAWIAAWFVKFIVEMVG